jgi:hypothetical protein
MFSARGVLQTSSRKQRPLRNFLPTATHLMSDDPGDEWDTQNSSTDLALSEQQTQWLNDQPHCDAQTSPTALRLR